MRSVAYSAPRVFAGLGYLVSDSAEAVLGRVRRIELWLLGAVIAAVVIVYVVNRATRRELHLGDVGRQEP